MVENLNDSEFTIDRLCREMAMSRTLFYVKLKSYTGKSPQGDLKVIINTHHDKWLEGRPTNLQREGQILGRE